VINKLFESKNVKKITIIALHLGFGGVENVICSIANMLCEKYEVEVISTYKLLQKPAFDLDKKVKVKYLLEDLRPNRAELKEAINNKNIFGIFKQCFVSGKVLFLKKYKLIKEIKKIDANVIITTRYIHNKWVGKYAKKNIIKIAQEHNHHNCNKKYLKKIVKSLKNIDYLMPASKELKDFYEKILKNKKIVVKYIPHSLGEFPEQISKLMNQNIIAIGRLSKEKGFPDLINVYKRIYSLNKNCRLRIIGDGSEKENLEKLIIEANLLDNIELCGFKSKAEISKLMMDSSLYLMTSYTESFGLVLVEAESYGLPIIAFDSAQGAKEIIRDGKNGFLIKNRDIDKMVEKSDKVLNDFNLRMKLGECGRKYSEVYRAENISKEWIHFIEGIFREEK